MSLRNFALSKATALARAHADCIKKLRLLPEGGQLADTYDRLANKEDVIRYGVLFPFIFEDWLDLSNRRRKDFFWKIAVHILCLYSLILELDEYQDSNYKKRLGLVPETAEISSIQKMLESGYADERSKHRTEWQNILITESVSMLDECESVYGFDSQPWIKHFLETARKASATFILETIEDKIPGRLTEKLAIAADKNQMIMASAILLAPLVKNGRDELLYMTAQNMMLPIQLMDDLYDWQQDYADKKYTTLLRDVPNWDMGRDELYIFLTERGYFQEMLEKTLGSIDAVLSPFNNGKIGRILYKLFSDQRADMAQKLEQVKQFYSFIKNKKEVL